MRQSNLFNDFSRFIGGLKEDFILKFEEAGNLAKDDIAIIVSKFDELKKFVNKEKVNENIKATQTAAGKLVKTLVDAVEDLREASEDAAEKRWYNTKNYYWIQRWSQRVLFFSIDSSI